MAKGKCGKKKPNSEWCAEHCGKVCVGCPVSMVRVGEPRKKDLLESDEITEGVAIAATG
jgi:hypothetical protein